MILYFWLHTKKSAKYTSLVETSQIMSFQNFQFNFLAKFRQYNKSCQSESLVQRFFLWLNSGSWLSFSKWLKICVCVCVCVCVCTNSLIKKIPK
jgi:hypothetical protein